MNDRICQHYIITYPDYGTNTVGLMMCECGNRLTMDLKGKDIHCKCGRYYNHNGKSPEDCFMGEAKRKKIELTIMSVCFGIVLFVVLAVLVWVFLNLIFHNL